MRPLPWLHLEQHRVLGPRGLPFGAFTVLHRSTNTSLRMVVSNDLGWEHVSVSTQRRTPNWPEMEYACRLFWTPEEAVLQLHPPRSAWISNHPFCLHLWRPTAEPIPLPPSWMVGAAEFNGADGNDPKVRAAMDRAQRQLAERIAPDEF